MNSCSVTAGCVNEQLFANKPAVNLKGHYVTVRAQKHAAGRAGSVQLFINQEEQVVRQVRVKSEKSPTRAN